MMRTINRHTNRETASIDVPITAAIRVAGTDEIGSVHVVTNRRPTYAALVRYYQEADRRDVTLSVEASGITVRPPIRDGACKTHVGLLPSATPPPPTAAHTWHSCPRAHLWRRGALAQGVQPSVALSRVSSALDWVHAHAQAWRTEFTAMSEGTR
jgi:hypothetical protein